ncbi:MAG TPA: cytidylate kinase-like family protein [Candidatus Ozemobacteraceae bacterium]|nr:cytidylate kinase-like family protein [Candidatus Ozemobacteraceae bacterium]
MPIITISRELGAGGTFIALKLAEAIGGTCVEKEIIHEIAKKMGKSHEDLTDFDQDSYNRIGVFFQEALSSIAKGGRVFHPFGMGPLDWETTSTYVPSFPDQEYKHDEYIDVLTQVIKELAAKGNVVLLGRGAGRILHDHPDAFHLRVVADMKDRLARVMDEQKIDEEKARELIERRDASAGAFLSDFFEADWNDPHLYHLTINTSRIPAEEAVPLVLAALKRPAA